MKHVLAFLVLLSHINFAMFIPQMDEVDVYDADGQQKEDINSLYQYIDYVILGNKSHHHEDGDDDTARFFHIVKLDTYCFSKQVIEIDKNGLCAAEKTKYPPHVADRLVSFCFDTQLPPPKA